MRASIRLEGRGSSRSGCVGTFFKETPSQLEAAQKTVAENGSWQGELHQITKQGKEIIVSSRWSLVRAPDRGPKSILVINTEITLERERSFYNGSEIIQPRSGWTPEEQLWLLDHHPVFTARCFECETEMKRDYTAQVHFNCSTCGWKDDTL